MLTRCIWLYSLVVVGAYLEYPVRRVSELNPWIRTFANGSQDQVQLPDVFHEREVVTYSHSLQRIVDSALVKFTCSLRCDFLADGTRLAANDSPYLPVFAELPPGGVQELKLVVDSRFLGRHTLQQLQYDWWQPGGVFNVVELHVLRARAYLKYAKVFPNQFPWVRVETAASIEGHRVAVAFDDHEPMGVAAGADLQVPGPRRWSPSNPELHSLTVYLLNGQNIEDVLVTRFGLRNVEAREGRVLLNGAPVRLLGANRHHFGRSGAVVSEEDMLLDLTRLKHLGGNFIRGAHYPQDPRFLDLCDEEGVLVWEEALAWQNTVEELTNDTWLGMQKAQIRRMTESSANHPSVIIYGFLNEGQSADPRSVPAYQSLAAEVRACDPTRLVGWASSVTVRDLAWEFADVLGFNDYSAWYPTTAQATVEDFKKVPVVWRYYAEWAEEHFPGKPLIASEFGAGGPAGRRGSSLEKWTEECQSVLVQLHLLGALQAGLAGAAVWQLADCPVDPTTNEVYRPGGLNDKGLLTTNRTPKLAYASVYAIFHGEQNLRLPDADVERFREGLADSARDS